MENLAPSVWIVVSVIIGTGLILRQSIINSINEGFKNESFEKQKRWELKQEIYFELLESLYKIGHSAAVLASFYKDHHNSIVNNDAPKKEGFESAANHANKKLDIYNTETKKLTKNISIAPIILDKQTIEELNNLLINISTAVQDQSSDSFNKIVDAVINTRKEIINIAQKDLKIESPT